MIRFQTLTKNAVEKIKSSRYDSIIESKHEGPWRWSMIIDAYDVEFLQITGKSVLFPLDRKHHENIRILRSTIDKDEQTLTVFLTDRTYIENPEDSDFSAGFVAICDKVPGEDFHIAIFYHEWFVIDEHLNGVRYGN